MGESVQFRNLVGVALDTLVFRVVPNALRAFELTELTVDGLSAERRLDGSVLEVVMPRPLLPGQTTQVAISYTLVVPREPGRMTARFAKKNQDHYEACRSLRTFQSMMETTQAFAF